MPKMTTLCYLDDGERYMMLLRNRKQNDENLNKWIGVGGKFEDGETPEECMKREVAEETGLEPSEWRFRGIVTFVSDIYQCEYMHLFTCTKWEGTPHPCNEGELRWIDKRETDSLNLWEGDRLIFKLLETHDSFFSLKLTYQGDKLVGTKLRDACNNLTLQPKNKTT